MMDCGASQFDGHQSKDELCNIKFHGVLSIVNATATEKGNKKFSFQIGRS